MIYLAPFRPYLPSLPPTPTSTLPPYHPPYHLTPSDVRRSQAVQQARRFAVHASYRDWCRGPGDVDAEPGRLQVLQDSSENRENTADWRQVCLPSRTKGYMRYSLQIRGLSSVQCGYRYIIQTGYRLWGTGYWLP